MILGGELCFTSYASPDSPVSGYLGFDVMAYCITIDFKGNAETNFVRKYIGIEKL